MQNQTPILIHVDNLLTYIIKIPVSIKNQCKFDKILRNFHFDDLLWVLRNYASLPSLLQNKNSSFIAL